jgi:hypothetical protein
MTGDKRLVVVSKQKANETVARELAEVLRQHPALTIPELADKLLVPQEQVAYVLDAYSPTEGNVGVGRGGGWVPMDVAIESGAMIALPEPIQLGYRWPDATLRAIPFDEDNSEHRLEMGMPPLEEK